MEIIVGTAGHIDHGKTALIKALTGIDADRLPEEKQRGITIDLGFAELDLGDVRVGFVDVPGHERFVKNMLAGASGIDLVILVIAADEGVMPQTREHFDICRLLGINAGIVVLTKTDLVDPETLELAKIEAVELVANTFLENADVVCVSSKTGDGIDALKNAIRQIGANLPPRGRRHIARLPIDRSFSMKGFGTVVTGTLASGEIAEGTELELLPTGTIVRVRGLQTHNKKVNAARAGQRVAVNLGGIDHSKITRGMTLSSPNVMRPMQIIDAEIEVLSHAPKPMRSRQRVRVHIGTIEVLARIQVLNETGEIAAGARDFAQMRLETPVSAILDEKFILRSYSPQATIAGGKVIDAFAAKHRRKDLGEVREFLARLLSSQNDADTVRILLDHAGFSGLSFSDIQACTALTNDALAKVIGDGIASRKIVDAGGRLITVEWVEALAKAVETALADFHKREPLAKGITREALRDRIYGGLHNEVFSSVVLSLESSGRIVSQNEKIRLASHRTTLSDAESVLSEKIRAIYKNAGLEVPRVEEALAESIAGTKFTIQEARKYLQLFLDSGEIVKVTGEFYFARKAIDDLIVKLRRKSTETDDPTIDVTGFKTAAGISRKYAIPLLEYFDRERVTQRFGDKRIILK